MTTNNEALNTDGTWLQGTIEASYGALVKAFGEPSDFSDGKSRKEWALDFGGCIATIYDWKQYSVPTIYNVSKWNIGGYGPDAAMFVRNALSAAVSA